MSDIMIALIGLVGVVFAGFFGLSFFGQSRKVPSSALEAYRPHEVMTYQMPPERKPMMEVNSQVLLQGVAQQIASIGLNEAFDVEHTVTENGQRVRFARIGLPPLVRPMILREEAPQLAHNGSEKELRKLRKVAEKVAANVGGIRINQQLDVDGVPCLMKKSGNGYDLFLIKPDGSQQFMAHVGGPS